MKCQTMHENFAQKSQFFKPLIILEPNIMILELSDECLKSA